MITVLWHDEESNGWTGLFPRKWFIEIINLTAQVHEVRSPRGKIHSAKCDLVVASRSADLDYRPHAAFNRKNGILIGLMRLEFQSADRQSVSCVLWKEGDGNFVLMPTTVGSEDGAPHVDFDMGVDDFAEGEGRKILVTHLRAERSRTLVNEKKKSVLRASGSLLCEACGFSFEEMYGEAGKDFCEIHHKLALSKNGPVKTSLGDLAVLCSNCHRMIHRVFPMLSVEEFRLKYLTKVESLTPSE